MLAETYSRRIDCNRGIALSEAIYHISQKAITTIFEKKLRDAYLFCAGYSLNNWIVGLNSLGRYKKSKDLVEKELKWLKNRSYEESSEHQCMLRLNLIEAYLGLAHGNDDNEKKLLAKVETILNTSNWDRLEGAYKFKLTQLRQQYARLVQDATNLPVSPDEKQELEEFNKDIEQNLHIFDKSLEKIREIAPEIAARLDDDIKEIDIDT